MSETRIFDLIALVKPRVTALVLFTTGAGLWFSPFPLNQDLVIKTLLGTVLMVGAANALNMYLERDIDALMRRTQNRPLPAKRLVPAVALWLGLGLACLSLFVLALGVNLLTACLAIVAFVSYVFFYTPLKQKSHVALLVGAVPGALPPLMGWTAATGGISMPGIALFAILFLWQIPHFLAIALMHKEEYEKAGIRILPLEKNEEETKHWIVRYLLGLIAVSFYPVVLGMSGPVYLWTAVFLDAVLLGGGLWGLRRTSGVPWAKKFFLGTIVYLPVLLAVLTVDKIERYPSPFLFSCCH